MSLLLSPILFVFLSLSFSCFIISFQRKKNKKKTILSLSPLCPPITNISIFHFPTQKQATKFKSVRSGFYIHLGDPSEHNIPAERWPQVTYSSWNEKEYFFEFQGRKFVWRRYSPSLIPPLPPTKPPTNPISHFSTQPRNIPPQLPQRHRRLPPPRRRQPGTFVSSVSQRSGLVCF